MKLSNSDYKKIRNWLNQTYVKVLGLSLVFFEASFWFIFPDLFLFYYIVLASKSLLKTWIIFVFVSTIGTVFYWYFCQMFPQLSLTILSNTPGVTEQMQLYAFNQLNLNNNFGSLVFQSISGTPVKVWTWFYSTSGQPIEIFLFPTVFSRALRMGITVIFSWVIASFARDFIKTNPKLFIFITFSLFLIGWQLVVQNFVG